MIRLLRSYARTVADDQPFSFLYFGRDAVLYRHELQGVSVDIRGGLTSVRDWWLHPEGSTRAAEAAETG